MVPSVPLTCSLTEPVIVASPSRHGKWLLHLLAYGHACHGAASLCCMRAAPKKSYAASSPCLHAHSGSLCKLSLMSHMHSGHHSGGLQHSRIKLQPASPCKREALCMTAAAQPDAPSRAQRRSRRCRAAWWRRCGRTAGAARSRAWARPWSATRRPTRSTWAPSRCSSGRQRRRTTASAPLPFMSRSWLQRAMCEGALILQGQHFLDRYALAKGLSSCCGRLRGALGTGTAASALCMA